MSAWLCPPEHIAEIVKHSGPVKGRNPYNGHRYDLDRQDLAELLARENVRSLQYRYPESWEDFFFPQEGSSKYKTKAHIKINRYIEACRRVSMGLPTLSKKDAIGLSHSYEYQACECEDFYSSNAYFINSMIREDLYRSVVFPNDDRMLWDYPYDSEEKEVQAK
tara:strand:+ start:384 stop:875 length:492 start_codon:yes stop_codon:yes gene_type:complete